MCACVIIVCFFFFFQAEDGIRDLTVTGVQTCALPIYRILGADLDGRVEAVTGRGDPGLGDGSFDDAASYQPQGLALDGDTLYVADTENHALRTVDLGRRRVTTLAGTGAQLMGPRVGGPARATSLSSPWDLTILDGTLYVAMAGTHQLWAMRLGSGQIRPPTGARPGGAQGRPRRTAAV